MHIDNFNVHFDGFTNWTKTVGNKFPVLPQFAIENRGGRNLQHTYRVIELDAEKEWAPIAKDQNNQKIV